MKDEQKVPSLRTRFLKLGRTTPCGVLGIWSDILSLLPLELFFVHNPFLGLDPLLSLSQSNEYHHAYSQRER
jgi:hypothetical protein